VPSLVSDSMTQTAPSWPSGDGEMAERVRAHDWSATPLGPVAGWSERLRLTVEQVFGSPLVSTLTCGPQHLLLYNDAAARLFGDHHPGALGRPLPDAFPEGWATVAPYYARALAGETVRVRGQPLDTRGEGVAADVFDALLAPVRESDGSVAYVHMTGAEVANRARTEAALRESETRHRLLIESWAQAVWETDARGVVVADSPSWRVYTGQTLQEWLGYGWVDAIHPDDRAYAGQQWREAIAARRLVDAEFRLRSPDGGWRWTNVRAAPVLDADGKIEKWAGLNIDIDARKRAEAALRTSEERYRSLFASMDEAYAVVTVLKDGAGRWVDFRFLEANRAFMAHTSMPYPVGRTATELLGSPNPRWTELYGRALDTGEPIRIEETEPTLGRTFDLNIFALDRARNQVAVLFTDITARKRAELELSEREERQAFLLTLSDALRSLADPVAIQDVATRFVGEHLKVSRAVYAEFVVEAGQEIVVIEREHRAPDATSFVGRHPAGQFGPDVHDLRAGRTIAVPDTEAEHSTEAIKETWRALGVRARLGIPLVKQGRLVAGLGVHSTNPRPWSDNDVQIVLETAERTWAAVERARAEASRRESDERFHQFARASSTGLWIRDADTLAMEFVSPAVGTIYGVESDALLGDVNRWAAMIVPEEREAAIGHLEAARAGDTTVHEFRIQRPSDGAFRWIRNTDFPLRDDGRVQRVGGIVEDVTETRQLTEHQGVLLAELQHRVRNIMGMIRSMGNRTEPGASSVADYRALLEGRLLALARVQALLTRKANAGGSLRSIIESEVAAQAHHGGQFDLTGPDIDLSPKAVEVLSLAFHELATNALKYGALSVPEGHLSVRWALVETRSGSWLSLDWVEAGAPPREPSRRRGFGSELIEARIPYELNGRGKITLGPEGARCHLEFPLTAGESILETDAPQPTTVFGGTLDMTGAPDLTGRTVLVVEDDYYLANDTAAALRGAGADVLGPCPSEAATRALLEDEAPTHAVLDLNLGGGGPRFEIARLLKARGIPFVFLTGYDPDVIPEEMRDVVRLEKPLPFREIVEAVGQL
jgi:PAS domain S-box-containing protein